ncbi:MAG TPA: 50S ribosomal protein L5 [Elusimicrobia bacterium]|nr:50S ribosomal protein L5 [Elusimicrobiota bacterium]HBT62423.1 50S ribosomal protein L5 [Elusimicrobiota bacterium]
MTEKDANANEKAAQAKAKALAAKKAAAEAKAAKSAGPSLAVSDGREVPHPVPRLKKRYKEEVVPALMERHGFKNPFQCPRLVKIVLNVGVSEARDNIQVLDGAREELALITGQWPQLRRAHKSISNFKLRQGMPIGLRVTLRGDRMFEFLDRLISTAIPRIRDFRGLEPRGFDGTGNFNLGLREQMIFPEINVEKTLKQRGMNITFVTSAGQDELSRELLAELGFPFKALAAKPAAKPEAAASAVGRN